MESTDHPGHITVQYSTSSRNAKLSWVRFCKKHMSTNSNFWQSLRKRPVGGTGKLTGEAKSRCICITGCNYPNSMSNRAWVSPVYITDSLLISSMTFKHWDFVFSNVKFQVLYMFILISLWYSRQFTLNCSGVDLGITCASGSLSSGLSWKWARGRRGFLAGWE